MEDIVKLIIPFLIFLFFIFRTLSQRKAKAQEEAEVLTQAEIEEEESEVINEKEMNRRHLERWFTEEEKRANPIRKRVLNRSHNSFQESEKHPGYQVRENNSIVKKHKTEQRSASISSTLIRLRSKEEAKRAFLYSEIFNRKY